MTTLFLGTLTGVLYGYLRLTTDSAWPAVIAHCGGNVVWGLCTTLTVSASPVALEYLAGESGLLPLSATAVVAIWLLQRLGQGPRAAQQPIASDYGRFSMRIKPRLSA